MSEERDMDSRSEAEKAEERRERMLDIVWNVVFVTLLAILAAVILIGYAYVRESRRTFRERIHAACPSGTAERVIDEVDKEPCVALCNRVADFIFGMETTERDN